MGAAPQLIPSRTIGTLIKETFLRPALTSTFEVHITPPTGAKPADFFKKNGVLIDSTNLRSLILWCSDATLPGSTFATHESNDDFHGTTERFAYRRLYDDRIDLTYYVDATNHYSIRFFEIWMKYIANESIAESDDGRVGSEDTRYFYRFRYPDGEGGYRNGSSLFISKFERDYDIRTPSRRIGLAPKKLVYSFIKPYPISIQSIPVSYDTSQLLKCTVSMSYIRYVVLSNSTSINIPSQPGQSTASGVPNNPYEFTPEQQAQYNSAFGQNFNFGNFSPGTLTNPSSFSPPFSAPLPDPLTQRGTQVV